jgi:hypothetical protein
VYDTISHHLPLVSLVLYIKWVLVVQKDKSRARSLLKNQRTSDHVCALPFLPTSHFLLHTESFHVLKTLQILVGRVDPNVVKEFAEATNCKSALLFSLLPLSFVGLGSQPYPSTFVYFFPFFFFFSSFF